MKMNLKHFCKKWGIREFSMFGSVLKKDFNKDSDIGVLVTFYDGAKHILFDFVHMQDELKHIFKREVDIVSKRPSKPAGDPIKNAIVGSAVGVYAA